jgi:signal transduction histidine kinase
MTTPTTAPPGTGADRPRGGPEPQPGVPLSDDLAAVAPAFIRPRELLRAPVSRATWRAYGQAAIGFPWLLVVFVVALTAFWVGFGLAFVFGVGLLVVVVTLLAGRGFARAERARLHAQLGVRIDAPAYRRPTSQSWWARTFVPLGDARSWAHLGYAGLGWFVATLEWGLGLMGTGWALALVGFPLLTTLADLDHPDVPVLLPVALGVVALWAAPLATQALTLAHVRLARPLLGPSRRQQDEARMRAERDRAQAAEDRATVLTQTRTAAVGAADEERRRIERDLHDGAQQRLVALGVELGVARRTAESDPDAAAAALDHAHREVKETLAELRDLVRGIHPAVLTDRGLDAALSALAARSPVPVTVRAGDGLDRASATAQAAAYFVTAEALTNVAKHAEAGRAHVTAEVLDDGAAPRLRLVVADDGRGGAVAAPGSGLDGLRARVVALDGSFDLVSPAGRGTRLTVEVPCAS